MSLVPPTKACEQHSRVRPHLFQNEPLRRWPCTKENALWCSQPLSPQQLQTQWRRTAISRPGMASHEKLANPAIWSSPRSAPPRIFGSRTGVWHCGHPGMTGTALKVFLTSSHPKMPNVILTPEETADATACILSLRDHRWAGLLPSSNSVLITDLADLLRPARRNSVIKKQKPSGFFGQSRLLSHAARLRQRDHRRDDHFGLRARHRGRRVQPQLSGDPGRRRLFRPQRDQPRVSLCDMHAKYAEQRSRRIDPSRRLIAVSQAA
jgi:hypothetical protein